MLSEIFFYVVYAVSGVVIALFLPAVPKPYFSVIMAADDEVLGAHNITTER